MTGFTPMEVVKVGSRIGLTYSDYEAVGGPKTRIVQYFANDPAYRSGQENKLHRSAAALLARHLPWPIQWSFQLAELRRIAKSPAGAVALEKAYAPHVPMIYKALEMAHEDSEQKAKLFCGEGDYLGALWLSHLYWVSLAGWGAEQALTVDRAEAAQRAQATARMMLDALENKLGDVFTVLRFKAAANILVAEWNRIKPESRRGASGLRALVEELDIFEITLAQAEILPKNALPLVNALGVASAFHERWRYRDLEDLIAQADPKRINKIIIAPQSEPKIQAQYDVDFDDYRDWVEEGRPVIGAPN